MLLSERIRFKLPVLTISLYLIYNIYSTNGFYTQRQRYASRMLKITPKECHSPEFPNVTGVCMISLECQQRSGTVIGACRDRHLFGACCHDPIAAQLKSSSAPTSTEASTTSTTTTTTTENPSSASSADNEISDAPFSSTTSKHIEPDNSEGGGDSTAIPSLIDTFSELSPTFLSLLDLDAHTTGSYDSIPPLIKNDDHGAKEDISASQDDVDAATENLTVGTVTELPKGYLSGIVGKSEELSIGSIGQGQDENEEETQFKENMVKYIDELVTMRTAKDASTMSPKLAMSINDIPFSTFTIVTKSAETSTPLQWAWSSTTTESPPSFYDNGNRDSSSKTVMGDTNSNSSEEILAVSVTQSIGTINPETAENNEVTTGAVSSSTESVSPTKFTFSKLKYTPRPFKPRPTTEKVVWTRPTTTPTPFWKPVSAVSEEEEEEEDEVMEQENHNHHQLPSSPSSSSSSSVSSVEMASTTTMPTSTEASSMADVDEGQDDGQAWETSTTDYPASSSYYPDWPTPSTILSYLRGSSVSTENSIFESSSQRDYNEMTTNEISTSPTGASSNSYSWPYSSSSSDAYSSSANPYPSSVNPYSSSVNPYSSSVDAYSPSDNPYTPSSNTYASSSGLSSSSSMKSLMDETTLRNPTSASASWDSSIDAFVDQVVDGIVQDLNKSNKIDEMIFNQEEKGKVGEGRHSLSTVPTAPSPTAPSTTVKSSREKISKHKTSLKQKSTTTSAVPTVNASPSSLPTSTEKIKVKASTNKKTSPPKTRNRNKVKPVKKVTTIKTANSTRKRLDFKKDCGVRPLIKKGRIVGGTPSKFGSWPWHALVKETVWWGIFSKIKCGGVLIGAQHVLTAAHCQPQQTGTLSVVLGITDSDDAADTRAVTKIVRRVIPHPQFNARTYENDIAILELESPVDFQPHIVPICLPRDDDELEGKTAYVTGMGLLKHDGERPLILQEVDLPILNNTECQKMFVRSGNSKPIIESFICAGYEQGRKDSCGGDSGGPLSVKRNNGQWVLAGTVSHGIKCALPDQPGVYMRTSYYKPWIDRVLNMSRSRYRGIPRCNAPPLICARQRHHQQARHETGFVHTLFKIFRLARKMVEDTSRSLEQRSG